MNKVRDLGKRFDRIFSKNDLITKKGQELDNSKGIL